MNQQPFSISVYEVVGDSICVSQADGLRLFEVLKAALDEGCEVVLSFAGVESLTTSFLTAAVGQLLLHFSEDDLKNRLRARDLKKLHTELLGEVVKRSRLYYADREGYTLGRERVLEAA